MLKRSAEKRSHVLVCTHFLCVELCLALGVEDNGWGPGMGNGGDQWRRDGRGGGDDEGEAGAYTRPLFSST